VLDHQAANQKTQSPEWEYGPICLPLGELGPFTSLATWRAWPLCEKQAIRFDPNQRFKKPEPLRQAVAAYSIWTGSSQSEVFEVDVGMSSRILVAVSGLVTYPAAEDQVVIANWTCNCRRSKPGQACRYWFSPASVLELYPSQNDGMIRSAQTAYRTRCHP